MITKQEKVTALKGWLAKTELDPDVMNHTLGISDSSVNPTVLLEASKKLIKINRQEIEPDNRDSLLYNHFMAIEDFMKEHIEKDAGKVQNRAKMRIAQKKDLSWLQPGFFSPQIKSVIVGNSLSQNIEGHNPLDNYDVSHKVTKLGEGGITLSGI